jgi:hypothetical protein
MGGICCVSPNIWSPLPKLRGHPPRTGGVRDGEAGGKRPGRARMVERAQAQALKRITGLPVSRRGAPQMAGGPQRSRAFSAACPDAADGWPFETGLPTATLVSAELCCALAPTIKASNRAAVVTKRCMAFTYAAQWWCRWCAHLHRGRWSGRCRA